ncbi:TPA: hypothetical protein I7722_21020 [Vibrio vulnificus]|nr:hypothetical protein [Vibrio vulnificus]HAS8160658.1 hypothetical protein [Vibrio vulnificus]
MHGNDSRWRGGGVLSFYGIVASLVCLVSSLLFQLLTYNFGLLTFFCLLSCHPHAHGTHRAASGVAWCYRFTGVVAGFALYSFWL